MESWRWCFREGVAPLLSTAGLEALRVALVNDDSRLIQGATTSPPAMYGVLDWPVDAACPIALCGWLGGGLATVSEVAAYFAERCGEIDQRLGEPAAIRWFLNWADETPREEMRRELLCEVLRTLAERSEHGAGIESA